MDFSFGVLLTATVLGVTHAVEPDHLAGVTALSTDGGRWRAAAVGGCFAVGHVALVVAWVGAATLLAARLPTGTFDALGGTVLGAVLLLVAAITARAAVRSLHGDHAHGALAVLPGIVARPDSTRAYLGVGLVGALFTLSPPLSMLAFVTGVLPTAGAAGAWSAVLAYAVGIVVVMSLAGVVAGETYATLRRRGHHVHAAGQFLAAGVVGVLGVYTLLG